MVDLGSQLQKALCVHCLFVIVLEFKLIETDWPGKEFKLVRLSKVSQLLIWNARKVNSRILFKYFLTDSNLNNWTWGLNIQNLANLSSHNMEANKSKSWTRSRNRTTEKWSLTTTSISRDGKQPHPTTTCKKKRTIRITRPRIWCQHKMVDTIVRSRQPTRKIVIICHLLPMPRFTLPICPQAAMSSNWLKYLVAMVRS